MNILQGLSGEFNGAELTAIVGPSGAGKSTLLDVLSGYIRTGIRGQLTENGRVREPAIFRQRSCYIMQEDQVQPLLTVQEAMFVAANLKLPSRMTPAEKGARVKSILKAIGLYTSRKTMTVRLSGGQRKRLAVAVELVRNPPVMFFDEPTSGLDSSTSKQLVSLLRELARQGRTIVCTIHQPSASIFEMFDHLYAMAEGRCVYQGTVKGLLPFLEGCSPELKCPPYHNPADYLLEVTRGEYGDVVDDLVEFSGNGTNNEWRRHNHHNDESNGKRPPSPPPTPTDGCVGVWITRDSYTASFWSQFLILLRRAYRVLSRDRQLTYARVALHLFIALIIGTLYWGIGSDAAYVIDNFNYLFFSIMFNMFTAFSSQTVQFAGELPIIRREHFNRWYSVKSYIVAATLADLPVQLIGTGSFVFITYYMTGQPLGEVWRPGLFLAVCMIVSLVAQAFGSLISATLPFAYAVILGPLIIMPFLIFSGFFVHMRDAHPAMRWLFHISFLHYGLEALVHVVFGFGRPKLHCSEIYCHFVYPQRFLDQLDMNNERLVVDFIVLLSLYLAIKLITYMALVVRVSSHHR